MSTVETVFGFILICAIAIVIWWIASALFLHFLGVIGLRDKMVWVIKKKIDPKYLTKVDPIYKLVESKWDYSMIIEKWELGYTKKENTQFLLALIPYPIIIEYYEYRLTGKMAGCVEKEVTTFAAQYTLEEAYEKEQRKKDEEQLKKNREKEAIENLNKIFNENYE